MFWGWEGDAGVGFCLVFPPCSVWRPLVGENEAMLKVMGERFWFFSLLYASYDQSASLLARTLPALCTQVNGAVRVGKEAA